MKPLIGADELRARLGRGDDITLLDARAGADAQSRYEQRHLAGARRVDREVDLSGDTSRPERGGRHPLPTLPAFAEKLSRLGVRPETSVVAYDERGGELAAARLWWMLRAIGHSDVAVLDGGLAAAERAGVPTASGRETPLIVPDHYPVAPGWALPVVDAEDVERLRRADDWRLFDVRAAPRYRGEAEPIDPRAGHIEGARNAPLTVHLDAEGRFLPPADLRAHFEALLEGAPPERAIFSCGSGVTACHSLLALEAAGLPGARLYVGSWSEWCRSERARVP